MVMPTEKKPIVDFIRQPFIGGRPVFSNETKTNKIKLPETKLTDNFKLLKHEESR